METMATLPISRPLTPLFLLLFNFKQVKNKTKKIAIFIFYYKNWLACRNGVQFRRVWAAIKQCQLCHETLKQVAFQLVNGLIFQICARNGAAIGVRHPLGQRL